jgi:hypothetical protein
MGVGSDGPSAEDNKGSAAGATADDMARAV